MCYEIYIPILYKLIDGIRSMLSIKWLEENHINCVELAQAILPRKYKMMAVGLHGAAGAPAARHVEREHRGDLETVLTPHHPRGGLSVQALMRK